MLRLYQSSVRGAGFARMMAFSRSHVAGAASLASGGGSGSGGHGPGGSGAGRSGGSGGGGFRRQLGWWSVVAMGSMVLAGTAHAAKKPEPSQDLTLESVTNALWAASGPMLTNLGFSGCIGVAAGMALKKVGQFLAFLIGMSFLALQGLTYSGFVTVNWINIHGVVNDMLDLNKDGKVDEKDFKLVVGQGLGVLAQGVPSVGGFLAGFMLGVRM